MSKLKQSKQVLDDTEMLILMQNNEIYRLRNIIARYHLKHGLSVEIGRVYVGESIDFQIDGDAKSLQVSCIDCNKLGLKSNFMEIQELIKKLEL